MNHRTRLTRPEGRHHLRCVEPLPFLKRFVPGKRRQAIWPVEGPRSETWPGSTRLTQCCMRSRSPPKRTRCPLGPKYERRLRDDGPQETGPLMVSHQSSRIGSTIQIMLWSIYLRLVVDRDAAMSDSAIETALVIHGTTTRAPSRTESRWWQRGGAFCRRLDDLLLAAGSKARCWSHLDSQTPARKQETAERQPTADEFYWDGKNSESARRTAAQALRSH
jgi:hypothetical protein